MSLERGCLKLRNTEGAEQALIQFNDDVGMQEGATRPLSWQLNITWLKELQMRVVATEKPDNSLHKNAILANRGYLLHTQLTKYSSLVLTFGQTLATFFVFIVG